jgi:type IV fimbrial biogenesis protein FimT
MIEMLMTMAIAAILLGLAVPSFQYVTNSNRVAGEINGLLGDLQFARAEAIKEGTNVSVCVSADGATCLNSTSWNTGWIVFPTATPTAILRVQRTFSGTDTFDSNGIVSVTFNREGYAAAIAAGTQITLHTTPVNSAWTRCLTLNIVGQITTEQYLGTYNGSNCQ